MGLSSGELLAYARRIYIGKETVEAIADELSVNPKSFQNEVRAAIPALISEKRWDVADVIENLGGRHAPLEMRKEIQKLVKTDGLAEAVKRTDVSFGSAKRWSEGEFGTSGVQKMGRLPWKSLFEDAPKSTRGRGVLSKVSPEDQRRAVYRMLTGRPVLIDLAQEYNVSVSALYSWRVAMLGKSGTRGFGSNCKNFIAAFAAGAGEEPAQLATRRNHQAETETRSSNRIRYSAAFKRRVINRVENQNEPIVELAKTLGVSKVTIYDWRMTILGRRDSDEFAVRARALAKEFVEEAQIDDVVDAGGGEPEPEPEPEFSARSYAPQSYSRAPQLQEPSPLQALPIETLATVVSDQPNAIMASIDAIDQQMLSLKKDRQLLVQQLEIQKLRRALSDSDSRT